MQRDEFRIGASFWTVTGEWRCTDVGTRTIVAVRIGTTETDDPSWLNGPPYAVAELVFDENDIELCYPTEAERDAEA